MNGQPANVHLAGEPRRFAGQSNDGCNCPLQCCLFLLFCRPGDNLLGGSPMCHTDAADCNAFVVVYTAVLRKYTNGIVMMRDMCWQTHFREYQRTVLLHDVLPHSQTPLKQQKTGTSVFPFAFRNFLGLSHRLVGWAYFELAMTRRPLNAFQNLL